MIKILNIAWKDVKVSFRDPSALIMMLVTPFALTLAMGFAFGSLGRNANPGLSNISVIIVNQDLGDFGEQLMVLMQSADFSELLDISTRREAAAAKAEVDQDRAAAAVILPENFSESILPTILSSPAGEGNLSNFQEPASSVIEFYTNPTRPISAAVVRGIIDQFISRAAAGATAGRLTIHQMLEHGLVSPAEIAGAGIDTAVQSGQSVARSNLVMLTVENSAGEGASDYDSIAFVAPSMAIIFLMFTVTAGGRSLLVERQSGTLPRLLVSPTSTIQILSGKIFGIFLTGLAQMTILMAAAWLILGVQWSDISALALLLLALVGAASGWGLLLAAYARTPGQAGTIGTALTLIFAVGGGNFIPRQQMPDWLQTAGFISPNAWGLEAFYKLSLDKPLIDIFPEIAGLLGMAGLLIGLSVIAFRRQYR